MKLGLDDEFNDFLDFERVLKLYKDSNFVQYGQYLMCTYTVVCIERSVELLSRLVAY
jgi:hypothetical protein